jgi:tRNA nucleotidyltransferase/poly(A) polymerase
LTSGAPIRDLDVAVQGNATKLKKDLEKVGGRVGGTNDVMQALFLTFPGGVRFEVGSTLSVNFPKPGKPVVKSASILDDLRTRDFTANAMAVSLNEGSFGLLMDPLNGMADIENRELRLVSNYGFIEDPSRMIRAVRLSARLGWQLEERTQQRYDTGKEEGYIAALGPWAQRYELEEVFHEEDPLRVQRRLEAEGWSKVLFPAWTTAKANEAELERLRDLVGQFGTMGIHPDPSAAYFPLLTAKLGSKEKAQLMNTFAREGFAEEIDSLEARAKAFGAQLTSKAAATPSEAWKMIYAADPQAVLSVAFGNRGAAVQDKFKLFFNDWPQARHQIPYQLMQEMRITPEITGYDELLQKLFFAVMDKRLSTPEEARAFLEPYSPPAPPPPPTMRRRAVKRESKAPRKSAKTAPAPPSVEVAGSAESQPATPTPVAAKKTGKPAAPAAPAAAAKNSTPARTASAKNGTPAAKTATKTPAKPAAKSVVRQPAKSVKAAKPTNSAKSGKPARKAAQAKSASAAKKKPVKATARAAGKKSAPSRSAKRAAVSARRPAKKAARKPAPRAKTPPAKRSAKKAAQKKLHSAKRRR